LKIVVFMLKGCAMEASTIRCVNKADVERMLQTGPYFALRSIRCEIREDLLILTGSVPSFYLKQLAQTQVALMIPSMRLTNRIEVPERDMSSTSDSW